MANRDVLPDQTTCSICGRDHAVDVRCLEAALAEADRLRAENTWLRNQMGDVRGMQSDGATPEEMDEALGRALDDARSRRSIDEPEVAAVEEQRCEHCYQDSRCMSEPCPRRPKYPRGYDEEADREWDEYEALIASLPSRETNLPKETT